MLALLLASAAVVVAAIVIAASLTPRGTVSFVLAVALLVQAIVMSTIGFAGLVLRDLSPGVLLSLALAWPVLAFVASRRSTNRPTRWRDRLQRSFATIRSTLRDPLVAVAGLLVIGSLAWRTVLAVRLPVVDFDGWSYHLVFVDVWLQDNAIGPVPHRIWTQGYPAATEMLTTWLAAFTRTDALAGFTSLLPIPAAIAATTGLARQFGTDRRLALFAGLLLGMMPALVALAGTTYVDAASVASVTATWWLGLRVLHGERDRSALFLLGIAGGVAFGTKGMNGLLVTPILVVAALAVVREALDGHALNVAQGVAGRLAVLALPVLLLGGSWYLKNWLAHGNPVFPVGFGPFPGAIRLGDFGFVPPELQGKTLVAQLASSWAADWGIDRYAYNVRPGGFGRAWLAIVPIAATGLLLLARRKRIAAIALVVGPAWLTLATMPMPWYARLTLFVPALALPLAAVALSALRPHVATIGGLALVGLAAVSLVHANVRPNINIRAAFGDQAGRVSPLEYLRYVFDPSDTRRASVSLRAECAGFDIIPAGARVVPGGFNLLHGVAGPRFERILTEPLSAAGDDPAALLAAMRGRDATWLVTGTSSPVSRAAESAPGTFHDHGVVCEGGRLWQLAGGS